MSQLRTLMAIFAVVAAAAIIGTVGVFLTTAEFLNTGYEISDRNRSRKKFCRQH